MAVQVVQSTGGQFVRFDPMLDEPIDLDCSKDAKLSKMRRDIEGEAKSEIRDKAYELKEISSDESQYYNISGIYTPAYRITFHGQRAAMAHACSNILERALRGLALSIVIFTPTLNAIG